MIFLFDFFFFAQLIQIHKEMMHVENIRLFGYIVRLLFAPVNARGSPFIFLIHLFSNHYR